jgi:hypothetical protein
MAICPGCALDLPPAGGPTHPYIGASPECWRLYGIVLERAYRSEQDVLQLVVDAYACQHPGTESQKATQSVGLHMTTLSLFVESGVDPRRGSELHQQMVGRVPFHWLEPPTQRGDVTVATVAAMHMPGEYAEAAWLWARDVWRAWAAHHETVRKWARPWRSGPRGGARE